MFEKRFEEGAVIVREGDYGESFFRITKGSAAVFINYGTEAEKKLTELGENTYFGEMAVIGGYLRTASVVALPGGVEVLEIPEKELQDYFRQSPDQIIGLMKHIGSRIRTLTEDYKEVNYVLEELNAKEPAERSEGLLAKIKKIIGFSGTSVNYSKPSAEAVREANHSSGYSKNVITYPEGTVIFKEGEPAECMYDIHWGRVGIYTGFGTSEEVMLTDLSTNHFFGEMGMIEKQPRSATAVVLDEATLEIIREDDLEDLFEKNPAKIGMILGNLVYRLKNLTADYADACKKVKELA